MTRCLVTNDDGIASDGLRHLALAAVSLGLDVVVAAPRDEASGSGTSLRGVEADGRIVLEDRELAGLEAVPAHAVAADPGFIVRLACRGAFGARPDAVISGINRGANTGNAILHSGTVGAVLAGWVHGCPGLAVSLAGGAPTQWGTAAAVAREVLGRLLADDATPVLNVNVPDVPASELRGLRRARLATFGVVQTTIAEAGHGYVKLGISDERTDLEEGSDVALLRLGVATVTALRPLCELDEVDTPWLEEAAAGVRARLGQTVASAADLL